MNSWIKDLNPWLNTYNNNTTHVNNNTARLQWICHYRGQSTQVYSEKVWLSSVRHSNDPPQQHEATPVCWWAYQCEFTKFPFCLCCSAIRTTNSLHCLHIWSLMLTFYTRPVQRGLVASLYTIRLELLSPWNWNPPHVPSFIAENLC